MFDYKEMEIEYNKNGNSIPSKVKIANLSDQLSIEIETKKYENIFKMRYTNYLDIGYRCIGGYNALKEKREKLESIENVVYNSINGNTPKLIFASLTIKLNENVEDYTSYGMFLTSEGIYEGFKKDSEEVKLIEKVSYDKAVKIMKNLASLTISNIDNKNLKEVKQLINSNIENRMKNLKNCISENKEYLKLYINEINKDIEEEKNTLNKKKQLCKELNSIK